MIQFGRGARIAKSNIAHAYRQVPVHPHNRLLLGMVWRGRYFVDCTLPFGLRSAPLIFSAVAEALEWVARSKGAQCLFHYIDDFIFVGPLYYAQPSPSGAVLGAVGQSPGLDLAGVDQLVHRYAEDALAPATKRTYRAAQARYLAFCTSYNLPSVPVSQPVLCRFAALLASQHLLHSSIKAYLSAVRHLHVASCGVDPGLGEMVVLQGVLQGIKRAQARDQGHSPRLRLPVTAVAWCVGVYPRGARAHARSATRVTRLFDCVAGGGAHSTVAGYCGCCSQRLDAVVGSADAGGSTPSGYWFGREGDGGRRPPGDPQASIGKDQKLGVR